MTVRSTPSPGLSSRLTLALLRLEHRDATFVPAHYNLALTYGSSGNLSAMQHAQQAAPLGAPGQPLLEARRRVREQVQ
jgi:hypothetical protein